MWYKDIGGYKEGRFHYLINNDDNERKVELNDSKVTILYTGNVGIGTTSPLGTLHVAKDSQVYSVSSSYGLYVTGKTDQTNALGLGYDDTNDVAYLQSVDIGVSFNNLAINPNGGNVGIGTTSPAFPLHVNTSNDVVGYFKSTDNKALIIIADNDTTGYISAENDRVSIGYGNGVSTSNITILNGSYNVGIGTTSPAAGLQVARGGTTIPLAGSSTASAVFGNSTSDDNYGVAIGANSSGVGYISSQRTDGAATTYNLAIQPNGGNVGIGTSSPGAKLEVEGNSGNDPLFKVEETQTTLGTKLATFIQADGTNNPNLDVSSTSTGILVNTGFSTGIPGSFTLQSNGGGSYLAFNTNSANERMRIDSTGNVGIGTTSPQGDLHVVGKTGTAGRIYLSDKDEGTSGTDSLLAMKLDADAYYYNRDTGKLFLGTNNDSTHLTINSSGNVGIGTTSPGSILELAAATPILTLNSTAVNVAQGIEWKNSGALDAYIKQGPSSAEFEFNVGRNATWGGDFKFVTDTYDAYRITKDQHKFFILGSAKMTINSAGNVGIGTTSPASKLEVDGGDIEVDDSASGLILKSPDGTRYRVTVANGGTLSVSAV